MVQFREYKIDLVTETARMKTEDMDVLALSQTCHTLKMPYWRLE